MLTPPPPCTPRSAPGGLFSGGLLNFTRDEATLTNLLSPQRLSSGRLEKSQSLLHYFQRTQGKEKTCVEFVVYGTPNVIVTKCLSMQEG